LTQQEEARRPPKRFLREAADVVRASHLTTLIDTACSVCA
jgi:RNA polymerase sigma-70 factor, ECF subfamily